MIWVGIDADRLGDQADEDVVGAAGRPPAPGDGGRVGLEGGDQVVERLVLRIGRDDDDFELGGEAGDRRRLLERHRRVVGGDGADHHQPHHHQVVVVAGLVVDELGDADGAAGALDVVDLDRRRDALFLQDALHLARGRVPTAAGRGAGAMISIGVSVNPSIAQVACAETGTSGAVTAATAGASTIATRTSSRVPNRGDRIVAPLAADHL